MVLDGFTRGRAVGRGQPLGHVADVCKRYEQASVVYRKGKVVVHKIMIGMENGSCDAES